MKVKDLIDTGTLQMLLKYMVDPDSLGRERTMVVGHGAKKVD